MEIPAISINHLTVVYVKDPVLWNISFTIPEASLLAIVGPNGGGKSTLLRAMVQLIKPLAGTITFWGKPWRSSFQKIAYIPQRFSLNWHFPITVIEVILMGCYGRLKWFSGPSAEDRKNAYAILEQIQLEEYAHEPLHALSGGQQQRVLLGRALMQNASVYLMDEPFVGIDMVTEHALIGIFQQMSAQGKTIVIVHHDLHTVHEYFKQVLLLNRSIIAYGNTTEILMPEYVCAAYGKSNVYLPTVKMQRESW